ncbi:methyltransferase domain-containing protein [Chitinophaga sp. 30R24]|uniref:methyltransferase domain-containing protein n=1 Tax=Chitinophaga sp. 30R24 TaxID=3248838 RepID=UPI003B8EF950
MRIDTRQRSLAPEVMDDFNMEGEQLKVTLNKIAQINKLLGGNRITLNGVNTLIKSLPLEREISILDVGCGNGDMLRLLADVGKRSHRRFRLTGIDANPATVTYARELSRAYPQIQYYCQNIMDPDFQEQHFDIILCTLTLHHFQEEEVRLLVTVFHRQAGIGIVINDLQRSALAYRLFQLIGVVFNLNHMARNDGQISILRGFRKKELHQLAAELHIGAYSLQWKWAFRYQWIINTI